MANNTPNLVSPTSLKPIQAKANTTAPSWAGSVGSFFKGLVQPPTKPTTSLVNTNQFLQGYPYNSAAQQFGITTPKVAEAPMPSEKPAAGAIKAHTVNADGSTKTEYHNPSPPTQTNANSGSLVNANAAMQTAGLNTPQPQYSSSGGAIIPQTGNAPIVPQTPAQNTPATAGLLPTAPTSFGGLLGSLSQVGTQGSPAYNQAVQNLANFRRSVAGEQANIAQTPIELGFQQGRQQVLTQKAAVEDAALQNAVSQQLTQQGQQISALQGAAGLIPEALRYGNSANGLDPQSQANQLADLVAAGQITYSDALTQMGSYGTIGAPTLRNAVLAKNPNFNFAQAQALGSTQGSVAPLLNQAQLAIQNLQNVFNSIPGWQKTGIPALNALTGLLSEIGIGTGTQKDKENALSEARTQVANALGVATNTTPTAWTATVQGWFPDNATPDQIAAGIQQFNNLASNRQSVFGTPGAVQPFTPEMVNQNAQSNSLYSW